MSKWSEKFKDPRWQKKRLEILQRDGWVCGNCHNGEETLNVHHIHYIDELEPWEYYGGALITLCDSCHEMVHSHPFYLGGFSYLNECIDLGFINEPLLESIFEREAVMSGCDINEWWGPLV